MVPDRNAIDYMRNKFYYPGHFDIPGIEMVEGKLKQSPHVRDTILKGRLYYYMQGTPKSARLAIETGQRRTIACDDAIAQFRSMIRKHNDDIDLIAFSKKKQNWLPITCMRDGVKLYQHQQQGVSVMTRVNSVLLDGDCGVGKTLISIATVAKLKQMGQPYRTLVLCPKMLIKNAWFEDLEKFSHLSFFSLRDQKSVSIGGTYASGGKKRKNVYLDIPDDRDVYIMNYDIVPKRLKELKKLKFDIVIFDESSRLKNPSGLRAKKVQELAQLIPKRLLLSGSPMPNGIIDLWHQFYIMDQGATLSPSMVEYRYDTHKAIKRLDAHEFYVETASGKRKVRDRIGPRILRYRKKDLVDVDFPKKQYIELKCDLSPAQRKAYNDIKEQYVTWLANGDMVTAKNKLVELGKLQQITGGFVTTDRKIRIGSDWVGDLFKFKENPKLEMLLEHVESVDGKLLIWSWYRREVEMIAKALGLNKYIHGGVSDKQKQSALAGFKSGSDRLLVANQASIGHGQTLVAGNYMTYFSNSFDYEYRHQTEDRIHRIGQSADICMYTDIMARNTIDIDARRSLNKKADNQDFVMMPVDLFAK